MAVCSSVCVSLPANAQIKLKLPVIPKPQTAPRVRVLGTGVNDDRDTRGSSLKVKLRVLSDAFAQAKAMRVVVKTAVDETGRDLTRDKASLSIQDGGFKTLEESDRDGTDIELRLESPSRKAMTVSQIAGYLDVYTPGRDPSSVVTFDNYQQHVGKPLVSPTLESAGLAIEMWTKEQYEKVNANNSAQGTLAKGLSEILGQMFGGPRDAVNSVVFRVKDPNMRLVKILFEEADGKPVRNGSTYTSGTIQEEDYIFNFDKKLPPDARVKLYVATPKSIIKAPFLVKDLPLP